VAKKNTKPGTDQPAGGAVDAPGKRRASKKAAPASAPVDVATVTGTEPIDSASDTGTGSTGENRATTNDNNQYEPTHDEIAEAAYFRHLQRGGAGGAEFEDWVEAERELRQRRR